MAAPIPVKSQCLLLLAKKFSQLYEMQQLILGISYAIQWMMKPYCINSKSRCKNLTCNIKLRFSVATIMKSRKKQFFQHNSPMIIFNFLARQIVRVKEPQSSQLRSVFGQKLQCNAMRNPSMSTHTCNRKRAPVSFVRPARQCCHCCSPCS